jgi:hypothetical protein
MVAAAAMSTRHPTSTCAAASEVNAWCHGIGTPNRPESPRYAAMTRNSPSVGARGVRVRVPPLRHVCDVAGHRSQVSRDIVHVLGVASRPLALSL